MNNTLPSTTNPFLPPFYTPPPPSRPSFMQKWPVPLQRKRPTGVENPGYTLLFPIFMFQKRGWCFNYGSPKHVKWLVRLRDECQRTIRRVDHTLEDILVSGRDQ